MGKPKNYGERLFVLYRDSCANDGRSYFVRKKGCTEPEGSGKTHSDVVRILDKKAYQFTITSDAHNKLIERRGGKLVKLVKSLPIED